MARALNGTLKQAAEFGNGLSLTCPGCGFFPIRACISPAQRPRFFPSRLTQHIVGNNNLWVNTAGLGNTGMAHIIVVGNEKGGAGKSTVSMHVATALARLGHGVSTLDLDLRQRSLGRYFEKPAEFPERIRPVPAHSAPPRSARDRCIPTEARRKYLRSPPFSSGGRAGKR